MTIRSANQERLTFWSEFASDAMQSFAAQGFTREEALQLICAVIGGKELVWSAPPGFLSDEGVRH